MRFVVTEDYTYKLVAGKTQGTTFEFKAGQILTSEARIEAAVVNSKGEKP